MSIAVEENTCSLPDRFTFLSPGESIRHDRFGIKPYLCEMNGKVGYYTSLAEDFDEDADEVTMF